MTTFNHDFLFLPEFSASVTQAPQKQIFWLKPETLIGKFVEKEMRNIFVEESFLYKIIQILNMTIFAMRMWNI